jgi:tRNA/tmRNA/rRNA uracil-C5-methylase (TrmA/RlmC/RlmD family)
VGLFGLSLAAARSAPVTLVEGDGVSGRDLEENAAPYADRARIIRTSVEDFLRHDKPAANETFIVDPPRTGMSSDAVRAPPRAQAGTHRLTYRVMWRRLPATRACSSMPTMR